MLMRMHSVKGVNMLLYVALKLLLFAGDGPELERLYELVVDACQLGDNALLGRQVADIVRWRGI